MPDPFLELVHLPHLSDRIQVLVGREIRRRAFDLGDDPYELLRAQWFLDHIYAEDLCRARCGLELACEYPDQGCLARPVRTEESVEVPFLDGQADPVEGLHRPILPDDVPALDDCHANHAIRVRLFQGYVDYLL